MKIKNIYLPVALLACLASCSEDDTGKENIPPDGTETTVVKFDMNTYARSYTSSLSRSIALPAITKDNFRIMAFKKSTDTGKYFYTQDIPLTDMVLNNNALSGTARLPIGEYKFVSTYGLATDGGFALPVLTPATTELTNDLNIAHETVDGTSVFFLEKAPLENLHSYTLGTTLAANEVVSTTLTRAVSRVDVLFIQAKKNADGTYTEVSDSTDVFGVSQLAGIEMQFTGLNKNVNLVGDKTTTGPGSLFDIDFQVPDLKNTVTRGTSQENTKVGTNGFLNYDNITGEEIRKGSAHVYGAYVLPFADSATTTGLTLLLTNGLGNQRTLSIPGNITLERNKVTLIKIYVLKGTVFNTTVYFDIGVTIHNLPISERTDGDSGIWE